MEVVAVLQRKAIAAVRVKKEWLVIKIKKNKISMHKSNRDLLVLFKEELMTPQAIEHEVELLHELLHSVEKMENLVIAHEVINLNKYKVQQNVQIIRETLRKKNLKPFIFLNNKN